MSNISPAESANQLMESIGFDAEELTSNQHGLLSAKQQKYLAGEVSFWRFFLRLLVPVSICVIIIAVWDGIRIQDAVASRVAIVVFIVIVTIVLWRIFLYHYRAVMQDMSTGQILVVEGRVKLIRENGRTRNFRFKVGNVKFTMRRWVYLALLDAGVCRVYYTPQSRHLLSAEPVSEAPPSL